jgi:hypothetical protein
LGALAEQEGRTSSEEIRVFVFPRTSVSTVDLYSFFVVREEKDLSDVFREVEGAAVDAARHPWMQVLSGCGFYAKGILYIVIGASAIFVSAGIRGGRIVDPTGALNAIGQLSFGWVLLLFLALGSIGHGVWNVLRGLGDTDNAGGKLFGIIARSLAVCIGVFYLWLALNTVLIFFQGASESGNGDIERSITGILLSVPLGVLVVLFLGLGFIGAAIHEFVSGISGKYQEHYRLWQIDRYTLGFLSVLGAVSFTTRAVIYLYVSYFFLAAVFLLDPSQVQGFDGALLALAQTGFGANALLAAGFGLVCHGILAFFEAKYRRIC